MSSCIIKNSLKCYFSEASSLTVKTEDVVFDLQKNNRIILNCTYNKDDTEDISKRGIKWQKKINGTFEDVAYFSPPGLQDPFIIQEMESLYKNRTELIGPNTSLSAVMIIKDPVCTDEGTYRCWIQYSFGNSVKEKADSSVVVVNGMCIPQTKSRILRTYQTHSMIYLMKYVNESQKLYITFKRTFSFFFKFILMHIQYNKIPSNYKKITRKMLRQISVFFNLLHMNYSLQRGRQNLKSFWCFQMR